MTTIPGISRKLWLIPTVALALMALGGATWHGDGDPDPSGIVVPGEKRVLINRIAFVRQLVQEKKWDEAILGYERLLREEGNSLVPISTPLDQVASSTRSIQVRWLCHHDLSRFPAAALNDYRDNVDASVSRWLRDGMENRDRTKLDRIVSEAFCGRGADKALWLLGDLAFEEGRFDLALRYWESIVPLPSSLGKKDTDAVEVLRFPDSKLDRARIHAKQILALHFSGRSKEAAAEMAAFRKHFPDAKGEIAGVRGLLADILTSWLMWPVPQCWEPDRWVTFGGDVHRNRRLAKAPDPQLWQKGPTWKVNLPAVERGHKKHQGGIRTADHFRKACRYFPLIAGPHVIVPARNAVFVHDVRDGRELARFERDDKESQETPASPKETHERQRRLIRYTATVHGNDILTILGDRYYGPIAGGKRKPVTSRLVSIGMVAGPTLALHKNWEVAPEAEGEETAVFLAAPLIDGHRGFLPVARVTGHQLKLYLHCFHLESGRRLWEQQIGQMLAKDDEALPVIDEPLLTMVEDQIIVCTHRGLIISANATTGQITWAVRYPRIGFISPNGVPTPRDIGPCLSVGGNIYVAPADSDRLLCLDAKTGQTVWERDNLSIIHLLGCFDGKLVFTTSNTLRAVTSSNGSDAGGWCLPDIGTLGPLGRGCVLGEWIIWPTEHAEFAVRLIHLDTGRPVSADKAMPHMDTRLLEPGNYTAVEGCLVIAGPEHLTGFVSPTFGKSK